MAAPDRHLHRRSGVTRRGRKAVGYIWFTLIAMPVLLLSAAMSVDVGRVVIANREAANMADAAATAGALQYQNGEAYLNQTAADDAAMAAWNEGQSAGALGIIAQAKPTVQSTATEVTVTVTYQVTGLVFAGWFSPSNSTATLTTSASAQICLPGQTADTSGYCARPSS